MASSVHMAVKEDDQRHLPKPGTPPMWNESFWFAFYDPKAETGVTVRVGAHPNKGEANIYLHFVHQGWVVHSLIDHRAPFPPIEEGRLALGNMEIIWEKPLESFRLRYQSGANGMDVVWAGISPIFLYPPRTPEPPPPGPREGGHIEHGGTVKGTMTIGGKQLPIDCFGHRDHTWADERDWNRLHRWFYLSGEFGKDFWFNAVRVAVGEGDNPIEVFTGGLWDGKEVMNLTDVQMDVQTADGGTRALGLTLRMVDERQREHHIVADKVYAIAYSQFDRTWVKDGFARYRMGDREAYGILEQGYIEKP